MVQALLEAGANIDIKDNVSESGTTVRYSIRIDGDGGWGTIVRLVISVNSVLELF